MTGMHDDGHVSATGGPEKHCTSKRQALETLWNTLWEPFSEFRFTTREDKAVTAAALLTAVVRNRLPRAPAFAFDGPPASGKTSLVTGIAGLAGGDLAVVPEGLEESERRKFMLSALRNGQPSVILDNAGGLFGSATLAECLTLDHIAERTIGAIEPEFLPTNILVLIAGNNFIVHRDLRRRIVTACIDPRAEFAERRRCNLDKRNTTRITAMNW